MTDTEITAYLSSHPTFAKLSAQQRESLTAHARTEAFNQGENIVSQGQVADRFFILRSGRVTLEIPALAGPALEVQQLDPDQVLGWSWLIPPYEWVFNAKAEQDCTLLGFDGTTLLKECEQDSELGFALMKIFAGLMSERLTVSRISMMENFFPAGWA